MKRRIQTTLLALLAMAGSATAQSLTAQGIEAKGGEEATLTVSLSGATGMTALQFNLSLPDGMTITDDATLGTATNGHSLSVQTLANGDRLFVLYSMDMNTFKDGELMRIPVTIGTDAMTGDGKLYTVRTATAEAVSYTCAETTFAVTVKADDTPVAVKMGDANGDGTVDITDVVLMVNYILGRPSNHFFFEAADVNSSETIDITDVVGVVNIILSRKN